MAEKRAKSTRSSAAAATRKPAAKPAKRTGTAKAASKAAGKAVKKAAKPTRTGQAPRAGKAGKAAHAGKVPASAARKTKPEPKSSARPGLAEVVADALDEMKAVGVRQLDVRKLTDIADTMIIASGTSDRHVRSIADRVVEKAKKAGFRPTGVEGERDGEWVLVDLQDVIVHIMLPRVREFYRLESLWDVSAARREAVG